MNKVIDLRSPDLRKAKIGTIVITSKGYKFKLLSRQNKKESWVDLTSKVIWHDREDEVYTHQQATEKFGPALPTIEEFEEAEKHGFREVLPNMKNNWFWSASLHPYYADSARYFFGDDGYSAYDYVRCNFYSSVRCVGR